MIRRSLTLLALALLASLAIAGCGGNSPAATGPGGGTPVPGQPTAAPVGAAGHECDNIPKIDVTASATPVIPVDDVLLAKYPASVGGQPITNPSAVPLLAFICEFEGQSGISTIATESTVLGVDFSHASEGSFTATVNGNSVDVTAIRFPGQDAGQLVSKFSQFGALFGASAVGAITQTNIGGKNVSVSTDSGSTNSTYLYVSGDTLFIITDVAVADVTPVLQALP